MGAVMLAAARQAIRAQRSTLLLGMVVVALLAIAAVGSSTGLTSGGHASGTGTARGSNSAGGLLLATLAALLVVSTALAGVLIYALMASLRKKKAPDDLEHAPAAPLLNWFERVMVIALALLLIIGVPVLMARASRNDHRRLASTPTASPSPSMTEPPAKLAGNKGGDLWLKIGSAVGAFIVVVGALAFLLLPRLRKREPGQEASGHARGRQTAVSEAVTLSLEDLRRERDPRRAIVAAYAHMERVFAGAGLPRPPQETPTEYLGRVLTSAAAPAPAVSSLTRLFQEARFSHHDLSDSQREDALSALSQIRDAVAP